MKTSINKMLEYEGRFERYEQIQHNISEDVAFVKEFTGRYSNYKEINGTEEKIETIFTALSDLASKIELDSSKTLKNIELQVKNATAKYKTEYYEVKGKEDWVKFEAAKSIAAHASLIELWKEDYKASFLSIQELLIALNAKSKNIVERELITHPAIVCNVDQLKKLHKFLNIDYIEEVTFPYFKSVVSVGQTKHRLIWKKKLKDLAFLIYLLHKNSYFTNNYNDPPFAKFQTVFVNENQIEIKSKLSSADYLVNKDSSMEDYFSTL